MRALLSQLLSRFLARATGPEDFCIPQSRAVLCVGCRLFFNVSRRMCPGCGSDTSFMTIWGVTAPPLLEPRRSSSAFLRRVPPLSPPSGVA
ncbi:MAG: hypothetical protein ACREFI_11000 [Stellaceae bacterium]